MGYRPAVYARIVVGAGAMGASAAYFLSPLHGRTLVLERFHENHAFGSSHGQTRILRTAYAEGAAYVPLVVRARQLWVQLSRAARQEIFRPTGVILAARSSSESLGHARRSAERWKLPHEMLEPTEARPRFPAFRFAEGELALWDPKGGVLFPERAIAAIRRISHGRGTAFRWNSRVTEWRVQPGGRILVRTATREYLTDELVVATGAWMPDLVPRLRGSLSVEQQTVYWFRPRVRSGGSFQGMPAFVWYNSKGGYFYGTPDVGDGAKIGGCIGQRIPNPSRRLPPSARELRSILAFRKEHLPLLSVRSHRHVTCLYTNTPDKNFIVDFHPDSRNVVIVSACSGHGFKFATAIGELVANALETGRLSPRLAPFRLPR